MTYNMSGKVDNNLAATGDGWRSVRVSPTGETVVRDFWMDCALEGKAFQLRLGTITTAVTGDVPVADAVAEAAVNAPNGLACIPCELGVNMTVNLGAPNMIFFKSAPTAATVGTGTPYIPLPLLVNGAASGVTQAWTGTAGTVAVPAEVVTTTRRIFDWVSPGVTTAATNPNTEAIATVAWNPKVPHVVMGSSAASASFYLQVGATGTAPTYFAHFNWVELGSSLITA